MPEGGCYCGKIRIAIDGDPSFAAVCHCTDCRKISGSTYSMNLRVPSAALRLISSESASAPRTHAHAAASGNTVTGHFCGDCGTTLWRSTPAFGTDLIVKVGVLDLPEANGAGAGAGGGGGAKAFDIDGTRPQAELYVSRRVAWVAPVEGAAQFDTDPPS
ncbi:Mss4-like protein [Xylariaceae sp. FL0804]|nr:Mss4-like protein [Xylariaceae sp. FL0804]